MESTGIKTYYLEAMIYNQLIEKKRSFENNIFGKRASILVVTEEEYEKIKDEIQHLGRREYTEVIQGKITFFGLPIISSKQIDSATFF